MLFKIALFALVLIIVVTATLNAWNSTKKTALQLVTKNLDQYHVEGMSLIHPDAPEEMQYAWDNGILAPLFAAATKDPVKKDGCYGMMKIREKSLESLEGGSMTFRQEGADITITLFDKNGIQIVSFPAPGQEAKSPLLSTTLCLAKSDRNYDVEQIKIGFGAPSTYYHSEGLQEGQSSGFKYDPLEYEMTSDGWLDNEYDNLLFFSYDKNARKLCIMAMTEEDADSVDATRDKFFSHETLNNMIWQGLANQEFSNFCETPADNRVCSIARCDMYGSPSDCETISSRCGLKKCYPAQTGALGGFTCTACPAKCEDINKRTDCLNVRASCAGKMKCAWIDNDCKPEGTA